jgi:GTP cyclohydrolase II
MARTRIPTYYGPAFLHLYHNNRDDKEHLAIVIDPAQLTESISVSRHAIRSRSLDAVWSDNETEMDRVTRGAYVGRLTPSSHAASVPSSYQSLDTVASPLASPLVRIHSECFTGETVGSMRCDCGEQLDEALRLIFQPVTMKPTYPSSSGPVTIPGRGAIIYLRQEGRGIGLLSKIRAYNLQDMGHDTVTANLMLGHEADERGYEIAGAIMRDLRLDAGEVRLLTNNPDKVLGLEKEGIRVVRRIPMVPRSWQRREPEIEKVVHGDDLEKYLRTKVAKMGHLLLS